MNPEIPACMCRSPIKGEEGESQPSPNEIFLSGVRLCPTPYLKEKSLVDRVSGSFVSTRLIDEVEPNVTLVSPSHKETLAGSTKIVDTAARFCLRASAFPIKERVLVETLTPCSPGQLWLQIVKVKPGKASTTRIVDQATSPRFQSDLRSPRTTEASCFRSCEAFVIQTYISHNLIPYQFLSNPKF